VAHTTTDEDREGNDLATQSLPTPGAPRPAGTTASRIPSLSSTSSSVRRSLTGAVSGFGEICSMVLDSLVAMVVGIATRTFPWREYTEQTWFLISVTLLPTILIAIPFGLILVIEVGGTATQVGATSIVGTVDAIAIVQQAAPIITALLLSGAGGSAICSDLGARTIRDEIAALRVMGIDPVARLVAPRVLATITVALLLNGVVAFAGVLTGYITSVVVLDLSAGSFLSSFSSFARVSDIVESMFKAGLFGLLAAVVASHQGLGVQRGPAGVGEAVNRSVVVTGLLLFLTNLLLSQIFIAAHPGGLL